MPSANWRLVGLLLVLCVMSVESSFCPIHFLVARRVEDLLHRNVFEQHFQPLINTVITQHPEYRYHEHEYACWPDDTGKTEETAKWHYHGQCFAVDGASCNDAHDPEGRIVDAIAAAQRNLSDTSLPTLDRAYAFLRLLHLVTDIHQPLQVCNRRSKNHPTGDRGGSTFYLGTTGKFTNLHALYDYAGNLDVGGIKRPYHLLNQQEYATLSQRYEDFSVRYPVDPETAKHHVWDWVGEAMELCERFVYKDIVEGTYPSDKYLEDVQQTVMSQASKAAFRIAHILHTIAEQLDPTTFPRHPEYVPQQVPKDEKADDFSPEDDPRHFGSAPVDGVWLEPHEHQLESGEAELTQEEMDALHEIISEELPLPVDVGDVSGEL